MSAITVLITCYNGRAHLPDCLGSLFASQDAGMELNVVVVDNASTDDGPRFINENFPQVEVLRLPENRGFAGGNNAGWRYIRSRPTRTDYLAILNQDTIVQSGWLAALVGHLENRPAVAAGQAKILLWPGRDRINTAGNQSHYLGFGIVSGYGEEDNREFTESRQIDFASGAAMVVRTDALEQTGLFDDLFFLYLEDADLGWRLRQRGYRIDFVPGSVVWHKYAFQENYKYYYYLERNRWYLLGTYYKMPTLLLIAPAMMAMELGQVYFAWRNGVLGEKLRAWRYFFSAKNLSRLLARRREAQGRRLIGDRAFTESFVGRIEFSEIKSGLLDRVGNPLLNFYWRMVRRMIWW
ncbi:MAG: glycosyltransferase family 2 protein [Planctomycetota bacterium]|nr:glycosyltransferase family 2 protein [Planctomycetota bacterium]